MMFTTVPHSNTVTGRRGVRSGSRGPQCGRCRAGCRDKRGFFSGEDDREEEEVVEDDEEEEVEEGGGGETRGEREDGERVGPGC